MGSRKATPRPRRAVDPGDALGGLRNSGAPIFITYVLLVCEKS